MLVTENSIGKIEILEVFFVDLVNSAIIESFGVVRAVGNLNQRVRSLIKSSNIEGITIEKSEKGLVVDLHVEVQYGVNISEVVRNLAEKVGYTIEEHSGFKVSKVNVSVDKMSI